MKINKYDWRLKASSVVWEKMWGASSANRKIRSNLWKKEMVFPVSQFSSKWKTEGKKQHYHQEKFRSVTLNSHNWNNYTNSDNLNSRPHSVITKPHDLHKTILYHQASDFSPKGSYLSQILRLYEQQNGKVGRIGALASTLPNLQDKRLWAIYLTFP